MLHSYYTKDKIEAGVDEVGRGCLAGPVVAAAVILPKDYKSDILRDSKQLKSATREKLKIEIEQVAISYSVALIDNLEIDKINILNASFKAMGKAIEQLEVSPQLLLIDGNRFPGYPQIPHFCIVKGDTKYLSIAAASVLAKVYRDDLMKKYAQTYPHYGWESNMGYATKIHRNSILEYGICPLHRRTFLSSFKTTELFSK